MSVILERRRFYRVLAPPPRWAIVVLASALALVALAFGGSLGYRMIYANRIYPGVAADGIPLGGQSPQQAATTLRRHYAPAIAAPLVVRAGGQSWSFSRQSLGASYDVAGAADQAFAVGRTGSFVQRALAPLALASHGSFLSVDYRVDGSGWDAVLRPIANAVDQPAVDATLTLGSEGRLRLTAESEGARLDLATARVLLARALFTDSADPVDLPVLPVDPAVRVAQLAPAKQRGDALLSGPLVVSDQGATWILSTDALTRAFVLPSAAEIVAGQQPRLDRAALTTFAQSIANEVDRPAVSALLRLDGARVVLDPSASARQVDVDATVARLESAAPTTSRTIDLIVDEAPAPVGTADLARAQQVAMAILSGPLAVQLGDQTWSVSSETVRSWMTLPTDPIKQRDVGPTIDATKAAGFVAQVAKAVDRDPVNARFDWAGGAVRVSRQSSEGIKVDREAAVAALQAAALGSNRTVPLPVTRAAPQVVSANRDKLVGAKLIAEATTSYVGSIPPRKHNVELATARLNGVTLAPGQIFSFNDEEGPTTLDSGFQVGYGIEAQGDSVKTVPSVAGGICQVATTLFQPVFWTGYQIEERYSHAYWIAHYVSRGYVGLDTTVDAPSGLDFKFMNNTPDYLLIQASTDGTNVHFALYGTPPTWKVTVDPPVISNVVKTDPTWQKQPDRTLSVGQTIITEAAQDGFDVAIKRVVTDEHGDRTLLLHSSYAAAHNVMLIGTKPR